jgi:hypothetical protein
LLPASGKNIESIIVYRIFVARFEPESKNNWIYQTGYIDTGDTELYITSFYFTVTTIVTVGFGDII